MSSYQPPDRKRSRTLTPVVAIPARKRISRNDGLEDVIEIISLDQDETMRESADQAKDEDEGQGGVQVSLSYNSTDADVTLLSREGIHFKVHSYLLKANSTVFREMMSDKNMHDSLIPFDASEHDLTFFLDLMSNARPPAPDNWQQVVRIMSLADLFDCPLVLERLIHRLDPLAELHPWEVFCLASRHNQLILAKLAIQSMCKDEAHAKCDAETISLDEANRPTLSYLLGLFAAKSFAGQEMKANAKYYGSSKSPTSPVWWELAAKAFKPRT
ncbi:hypothetical protein IAU59_005438 [Kwoniella sp. CBS 9459]